MASLPKLLSLNLFVLIILCIGTVIGMRTHTLTHEFSNYAAYVKDVSSLTSPGQVFGACKENLINFGADHKFSMFCTFIMETTKPIEEEGHVRACNFSLDTNLPNYNESYYYVDKISAITQDKAVLGLHGVRSFMLLLLDFVDCKIVDRLQNDVPMTLFAATENKVDVITKKKHDLEKRLRLILNLDTETKDKEFNYWYKTTTYGDQIVAIVNSPDKYRIVVDIHGSSARIYALSENGSNETLKEYPIDGEAVPYDDQGVVTSTTHDLLTVCSKLNNTSTCSQFDSNGKLKFETKIPLEKARRLGVRNLPRGGFLLLIEKCKDVEKIECYLSQPSFEVRKFNDAGQLVGTLIIDSPSKTGAYVAKTHAFENEKKEICLSNVHKPEYSDNLKLNIICLKDDDFVGKLTWPAN